MTPLGKSLVFYLKHATEMNRLYADPEYHESEDSDLSGVDDAGRVQDMARTVGAAAHDQVADLLELCGQGIGDYFSTLKVGMLKRKRTRAYMKANWEWGARIYVAAVADGWFGCAVRLAAASEVRIAVDQDVCGVVVPMLWSKGGRIGADAVRSILGGWVDSRAGDALPHESGTIELGRIPIQARPSDSFDVDREMLIAEVMKTFFRISAKEVKAIAKFVARLKKPDET